MTVYEGAILTVDAHDTVARFLVEREGRIAYVGDRLPEEFRDDERVQLGQGALAPAFVDTHQHLASFAVFNDGLNVSSARSNAQIQQMVSDYARHAEGSMLLAFGASPHSVGEGRLLTRAELDEACPDRPMMMVKYDGHACVVNTSLLRRIEGRVGGLRGFHADTGEMNQEAFFKTSDYLTGSISLPRLVRSIQRALDCLAARGIGMVHTVSGVGFAGDLDISLETWLARSAQAGMQVRVFPQSLDVRTATRRGLPRIGGCFATALDGCFGSRDAALLQPYEGTDDRGVLYYDDALVTDFCRRAHDAGLQIEVHAIGDAAFEQATRCLEVALSADDARGRRHGVIHACLPTAAGIERCARLGIHLPMQTSFIDWPQEPDAYLATLLGPQRAARLNPLRTLWDAGIVLSAGSDAPCTDPDPILWMQRACNHSVPAQSLTVREALRMCTYHGAWVSFDEAERGSLEEGKMADMVVLSGNPYKVSASDLGSLKVERTVLQGRPYAGQTQGALAAVARGAVSRAKA
ncbi:amidohydrolase family protein [Eggerthellaceae bacterium zg-1084]|uniref:amidohydrolase n=1 Tax=Berryella wangjianweii TaxID=2734634 RepID=UPI001554DCD8|nr:amidohydrolase family protein [Berryella wangjianweii]NPD31386.1 amidohydrolase family protein [Berryella wangjianweii]NPD32307.1 amidohydrolase family protein [Eggerthellaceae bacterium zg-997]